MTQAPRDPPTQRRTRPACTPRVSRDILAEHCGNQQVRTTQIDAQREPDLIVQITVPGHQPRPEFASQPARRRGLRPSGALSHGHLTRIRPGGPRLTQCNPATPLSAAP